VSNNAEAQLDSVMSAMCWYTVLVEDKLVFVLRIADSSYGVSSTSR